MKKLDNQTIKFEDGGILKFEMVENGIDLFFQAPQLGDQIKIISMNVVLTIDEVKTISAWLNKAISMMEVK